MPRNWLVALCWVAWLAMPANAYQREALIIANQDYPEHIGPLSHAHADADLVARALYDIGFKVQILRDAGRADIIRETRLLAQRTTPEGSEGVGLLYYVGHGAADWQTGRNFLVPVDIPSTQPGELWDAAAPLEQLRSVLTDTAPASQFFLVIDASRDELLIETPGSVKGLATEEVDDVLLLLSTAPTAVSANGVTSAPASPFGSAFAEELAAGVSDAGELIPRIRRNVMVRTENAQQPTQASGYNLPIRLAAAEQPSMLQPVAAKSGAAFGTVVVSIDEHVGARAQMVQGPAIRARIFEQPAAEPQPPAPVEPAPQPAPEMRTARRPITEIEQERDRGRSSPEMSEGQLPPIVVAAKPLAEPVSEPLSAPVEAPAPEIPSEPEVAATPAPEPVPAPPAEELEPEPTYRLVAADDAGTLGRDAIRNAAIGGLLGPANRPAYGAISASAGTEISVDWRTFADLGLPVPEPEEVASLSAVEPEQAPPSREEPHSGELVSQLGEYSQPPVANPEPPAQEQQFAELSGEIAPSADDLETVAVDEAPAEAEPEEETEGEVTADTVRDIQTMLIAMGYLSNAESGEIDAATRGAVAAFRADQGAFSSNTIDAAFLEVLRTALADGVRAPPPIDLMAEAAQANAPRREPPLAASDGMFIRAAPRGEMDVETLGAPVGGGFTAPPSVEPLEPLPAPPAQAPTPPPAAASTGTRRTPGEVFVECVGCPQMIVIPTGSFVMGSSEAEIGHTAAEGPPRQVRFAYTIAVGRFEVSWDEWGACVAAGWCQSTGPNAAGGDEGWGRGIMPVINVAYSDALAYVAWLNSLPGVSGYRLLSEAEWEYAARGGASTAYSWGDIVAHSYANYGADTCCEGRTNGADRWINSAPVGSFGANAYGLYDMHGNVAEWVIDCWAPSYAGAPRDGSARLDGCEPNYVVARGGSWLSTGAKIRSAHRERVTMAARNSHVGFRIAKTMPGS